MASKPPYGDVVSGTRPLAWSRSRLRGPHRVTTYFFAALLLLSASATIYLWRNPAAITVYSASADFPSFHQLQLSDLQAVEVISSEVPSDAVTRPESVVGRYTLSRLEAGSTVSLSRLGPRLSPGALLSPRLVSLQVQSGDLASGTVFRGDRVDVLLSSTATDGSPRNVLLREVLLLDVLSVGDEKKTVVLDLSPADESSLLDAGGTARIFILRVRPYVAP
jgi:Flp pilus assembly protein CpaB